jgi:hypothetical protein
MGLDLMDAGYALGNYRFFDTMNETWKLATYLSNVVGMLLMHLPFGNTWIGMNVYTGLLVGLTAAGAYLFIINLQPENDKKELLLFMAELGALSLCWAPYVILYHYLGYILMTVASMILYTAITKDNIRYYIAAGIVLGICVAVRMPNITYMAFILPLWYYCFVNKRNAVSRTLYCIVGYLVGVLIPIGYIEIKYGFDSYPNMISSLFGMTETATDYKPTSMLTAMFGDYLIYGGWLLLFILYIITGVIFFAILNKCLQSGLKNETKNKITYVFKILYYLGYLVLLRLCYGRGMFGIDFTDNFSTYKWIVVYLLMVIILSIWTIIDKDADKRLKLWSVFLIVTIFITPLGSNNGLYPIINNLFIVAPISILLIGEFYKKITVMLKNGNAKGDTPFVIKLIITCVMISIFVASLLYGINFVFHDETTNAKRVSVSLKCDSVANGILTSPEKKETLEALDSFLYENNLNNKTLITYGNIPALSYILDMKPAIYTTWVELDSNSLERLETDLDDIMQETSKDEYPVIILGAEYVDELLTCQEGGHFNTSYSSLAYTKYTRIENFMDVNNYKKVYENNAYRVYCIN